MANRLNRIVPIPTAKPQWSAMGTAATQRRFQAHWADLLLLAIGCSAVALLAMGAYFR